MAVVRKIKIGNTEYNAGRVYYGTCSTAAATVAKEVVCAEFGTGDLIPGAAILVTNTNKNTGAVASLTLNVNGTGAKAIKKVYNAAIQNLTNAGEFLNTTLLFIYDGTYWVLTNTDYNTSYSVMSQDEASAGTATTGRVITAKVLGDTIDSKISAAVVPATEAPKMDGTATVGASVKYAREDHVHPSDTTKANLASPTFTGTPKAPTAATTTNSTQIATTAFVQNMVANYIPASQKGANSGVAELDSSGKVPNSQLPSYVDDVLEYAQKSNFPATGESGKIYISQNDNKTWRWSGTAYVEISPSLALGQTSATAFRGDWGKVAYDHAQAKGIAAESGLYKITTNAQGHVTAVTAVVKDDITALGIPGTDSNTDTKVTQTASTANAYYPVLSKGTTATATVTDTSTFNTKIKANHSTGDLQVTSLNGATVPASGAKFTDTTYSGTAPITVSGTAISHANSGVTAASKGDTTNQTPSWGGTFKAVSGTVNATGHLTAFADHTVTIPNATATTATYGLMAAADKTKLNGIASGAEVNQNAFSNIKVGNTTVAADTKTDTVEFAGSNVTITPDATNDKVTFGITKANVTTALGYTPVQTNTDTYPSGLTWTAGTTAGPVPNITRAGTTTTSVAGSAIPAASATASGIVTTENQVFGGKKTLYRPKVWHERFPEIDFLANSATGATVGEMYFDVGATNTISSNRLSIKAYSPVTGGSTTVTSFGEYYRLPAVDIGRTANGEYSILTSKTVGTATAAQIKTGTDTGQKTVSPKVFSDALTENTYRLYGGTPTSNKDLNTYITPGSYYCATINEAITYTNNPYSAAASSSMSAFRLYVIAATGTAAQYIYQKLEFYSRNDEWVRYSSNTGSTWSAWYNRSLNTTYTFTADNPTLAWGTTSKIGTIGGTEFKVTLPANPNTDTKVTSAANHYAPATVSGQDKTASASGATAAWSIDVVKGITVNTDGKGHITGLSVTSGKIPGNPNTDTKVTQTVTDTNGLYPVLAKATTTTTTVTEGASFDTKLLVNHSTGRVVTNGTASASRGTAVGFDVQSGGNQLATLWGYSVGSTTGAGWGGIALGNDKATGTAGNARGFIYLYGTGAGYTQLDSSNTGSTIYTAHFPNITGTVGMLEGTQTFSGAKTFSGGLTSSSTTTLNNILVGKAGAVTAGNYTTTMPTAAGTTGQIMFVLK